MESCRKEYFKDNLFLKKNIYMKLANVVHRILWLALRLVLLNTDTKILLLDLRSVWPNSDLKFQGFRLKVICKLLVSSIHAYHMSQLCSLWKILNNFKKISAYNTNDYDHQILNDFSCSKTSFCFLQQNKFLFAGLL